MSQGMRPKYMAVRHLVREEVFNSAAPVELVLYELSHSQERSRKPERQEQAV